MRGQRSTAATYTAHVCPPWAAVAPSLTDGWSLCVAQYTRRQWLATPNTTRRTAIGTIFQGQTAKTRAFHTTTFLDGLAQIVSILVPSTSNSKSSLTV